MKSGGVPRLHFAHVFFVLNQEWWVFHFANVRNSSAWDINYKRRPQGCRLDLPPPFLHTASVKNWMVGRPGIKTRDIEPSKQSQYLHCTAHAYVVLRMRRLVQHIHDVCEMHNRRNCVHGLPKLLVV